MIAEDPGRALPDHAVVPLADSELVAAIRAQQTWVRQRFPDTPADRLRLLPRAHKNADGTHHLGTQMISAWTRAHAHRGRLGHRPQGPPVGARRLRPTPPGPQ